MPRFFVRVLSRIVKVHKVNDLLTKCGMYEGTDFIDHAFSDYFNVNIIVHGLENVQYLDPSAHKLLFAANHPLGGLDGLAVIAQVNKLFGPAKGIVNNLLLHIGSLRSVFCGVNLYGANSKEIASELDDLYASSTNVCVFPAGMVSRKIDGRVTDLPWKKNFIVKSLEYRRIIVPVYVQAHNSRFFYFIADLRKKLGIKFNYELVLLPSEVFKFKKKNIDLWFGKPVFPEMLDSLEGTDKRVDFVRELVYTTKRDINQTVKL